METINGIPFLWDEEGASFPEMPVVSVTNGVASPFDNSPFGKDWDKKKTNSTQDQIYVDSKNSEVIKKTNNQSK